MNLFNKKALLAFCRFSIVFVVMLICAGNITNNVLLKYGFRDTQSSTEYEQTFSLVAMMNGTAPKPFVYRSTLARLAKSAAEQIDPPHREKYFRSIMKFDALHHAYFEGVPASYWTPVVAIAYHLMYLLTVLAVLFALLFIYLLTRMHGYRFGAALGFLAAFSFVYPLTFQQGAYFYDFPELFGLMGAVYFTLQRRMFVSTVFVVLASFNKETFFLVPIALFFLHDEDVALSRRLMWGALQLACCLGSRIFITSGYELNPGGFVQYHLFDNLMFWLKPSSYFAFYNLIAKGVFTPSLQNPLLSIPLFVFFRHAWKQSSRRYRRYFQAAFLPLVPLFACFGFGDEARNFSLAFPAIVLIALGGARSFSDVFEPAAHVQK